MPPAHLALRTTARLRVCTLLVTASCILSPAASAQAPSTQPTHAPAVVRLGKWAALGLAAGFTILGAQTHDRADRDYSALLDYCGAHGPCSVGSDGRYLNPTAESLYGRVRSADRTARAWLVGGQAALATGAVLFVLELRTKRGAENIPYSPYVAAGRLGTQVGVRVAWW